MGRLLVFVVAGGCGFHPAASIAGADAQGPDAHIDATPDAAVPVGPACGGKLWAADFSSDPTTYDHNGDGIDDFAMRNVSALPGTLASGVWSEPGTPPEALDTQPKQNFLTRTVVHVRMRNTQPSGAHGAVFWINVGYDGTTFAPLYVDLVVDNDDASQTATLYGKLDGATEVQINAVSGLDNLFHDIVLDIDPSAHTCDFTVDNLTLFDQSFPSSAVGNNDDRWASLLADGADSQFDSISVEVCP